MNFQVSDVKKDVGGGLEDCPLWEYSAIWAERGISFCDECWVGQEDWIEEKGQNTFHASVFFLAGEGLTGQVKE